MKDTCAGRKQRKPNILMIVADQLRADCLGCDGNPIVRTPHIDQLAREGLLFRRAFTPLPSCCPARQSLLTGVRPEALGALWNYDISLKVMYITPRAETWIKALKSEGYALGYAGKWHVSPEHTPLDFGFDDYYGEEEYARYHRRLKVSKLELAGAVDVGDLATYLGAEDPLPLPKTRTHWLAEKATDMIARYARLGQPWHIRLDFPEPHLPCRPTEAFSRMYRPEDMPPWPSFGEQFRDKPYIQEQQLETWGIQDYTWEDWAPVLARYYGIISQIDDAVGRVLSCLEAAGQAEDTLVILTSDHGDLCGGHRMIDKHYVMYDDVTRVPLVIRWPRGIRKPGDTLDAFVYSALDIPATIYDLLRLKPALRLHGASLAGFFDPRFVHGAAEPVRREYIVSTYNGQQFGLYTSRMIRTARWKYIWNTTDIDELYDLEADPAEMENLIRRQDLAGILSDLRKKLYNELAVVGDGLVRSYWLRDQLLMNRKRA